MKRTIATLVIMTVLWGAASSQRAEAMLIPSGVATATMQADRQADLQTIQKTLESKMIRGKLHAMGLSDAEIQTRLSRMSDTEIHQFASQIRAVHPAGDLLIGILIAVLLVVLIIYLIKRI